MSVVKERSSRPGRGQRGIAAALAVGFTIGLTAPALADTVVGGPLFGDTTWDLAGSPYIVTSSVLIGVESTLTIEPGVEVRIDPGLGISVGSEGFGGGTLVARGTAADPILFTSNVTAPATPAAGDWNAITFTESAGDAVFDGTGGPYLSGSVLEYCIVEYAGGGTTNTGSITIQASRPWLSNLTVRDSARAGVFAQTTGAPPMRIESSTFRRCSGISTGGGVHLTGGSGHLFVSNTFDDCSGNSGAGLHVDASAVDVINNTFTSNAASGNGGGLYIDSPSGTVEGNTFTDNSGSAGGGMILQSSNNATVESNTFTDNFAGNGGGFYINGGSNVVIQSNLVNLNTASSAGGGAYFSTTAPEIVDNDFLDNDTVNGEGGGAYLNIPNGLFTDNQVVGNLAGSNGGGLRVASSNATFSGTTVDDNTASTGRGGGLYVSGNGNTFNGGSVSGNFAASQGGGADVTGSGVTFNEVMITDNEAVTRGGGFHWSGTGGSLAGSGSRGGTCNTISGNVSPVAPAIWYAAAFAGDGSGDLDASFVCWGTTDPLEILTIIHDYFDDGSIGVVRTTPFEGGPIFTDTVWTAAGSPYVVMESLIFGNDATLTIQPGVEVRVVPGRAISFGTGSFGASCIVARGTAGSPILFTSSLPAGERAAGDWIGIFLGDQTDDAVYDEDTGAYVSGCILEHCEIAYAGGGNAGTGSVTAQRTSPAILDTTVRDSARAGIYADLTSSPSLRLQRNTFLRCTGVSTGGGINVFGGSGHVVRECIFTDNTGNSGAGADLDAPSVRVIDCSFTGNAATGNGGGLHLDSISGQVSGNSFVDNSASAGGGLIIQSSNSVMLTDNTMTGNFAGNGGGFYVNGGSGVMITGNTVTGNSVTSSGGGAYFSTTAVDATDNTFDGNQAINGEGGGVYLNIPSGTFAENSVTGNTANSNGGGMRVPSSNASFALNLVNDNTASTGRGGGAYVSGSNNLFTNSEFTGNFAGTQGGGLDVTGTGTTFSECVIAFNEAVIRGGGFYWSGTSGSLAGDAVSYNVVADNEAPSADSVYYAAGNGNDLQAQFVCWGLFDGGAITASIHDFFDDSSLGLVLFFPFIDDVNCAGSPCPADLDNSGAVDFTDLLTVLGAYGSSADGDVDGDGVTNFTDLLGVLSAFGPCP
jgi:parallel beta-helix repeat protein